MTPLGRGRLQGSVDVCTHCGVSQACACTRKPDDVFSALLRRKQWCPGDGGCSAVHMGSTADVMSPCSGVLLSATRKLFTLCLTLCCQPIRIMPALDLQLHSWLVSCFFFASTGESTARTNFHKDTALAAPHLVQSRMLTLAPPVPHPLWGVEQSLLMRCAIAASGSLPG